MEPNWQNSLFFCSLSAKFAIYLILIDKNNDLRTMSADQRNSQFLSDCCKSRINWRNSWLFNRGSRNSRYLHTSSTKFAIFRRRSTNLEIFRRGSTNLEIFRRPIDQTSNFSVSDRWNLQFFRAWLTKFWISPHLINKVFYFSAFDQWNLRSFLEINR